MPLGRAIPIGRASHYLLRQFLMSEAAGLRTAGTTLDATAYFEGWLAYQVARLSMMALLYGKLMLCMAVLSRLPSRYPRSAMIR